MRASRFTGRQRWHPRCSGPAVVVGAVAWLVAAPCVSADQGFWAELRVAAVQVDNPFNAPLPDLGAGWRFANEWSVGVTYGPWRVLDYDMRVLNDVISGPVMLSSLGAVGSYHFKTHAAWGWPYPCGSEAE